MGIVPTIDFNTLTTSEIAIIQAIADGTYFVDNETPSGTINGINVTFTLASAPNPASSLHLYGSGLRYEGGGVDYTLSGLTITFEAASVPISPEKLIADYRVSP